jgi:peptidoglycan-associated lipoprotein
MMRVKIKMTQGGNTMSSKVLTNTIVLALVATLALVGCKKKPYQPTGPVGSGTSGAGNNSTPPPITSVDIPGGGGVGTISTAGDRPVITPGDLDGKRGQFTPVYFDYDSAKIKPAELSKVKTVVEALKGNSKKMIVEGHCDERGTAEYNRALGERRAQAARAELVKLGIDAHRLSTISYGKERPIEPAHDDTAWSRNRRAEFVILDK